MVLRVSPQVLCGYLTFQVTVRSQFLHTYICQNQRSTGSQIFQVRIREPSVPNFPNNVLRNIRTFVRIREPSALSSNNRATLVSRTWRVGRAAVNNRPIQTFLIFQNHRTVGSGLFGYFQLKLGIRESPVPVI